MLSWSLDGRFPENAHRFRRMILKMTFEQMFRDRRWHERKKALLEAAGSLCEECKLDVDEDGVHICFYPKGQMVWEYSLRAFKVLCPTHRRERTAFERQLRDKLPDFTTVDLGVFLDVLERLLALEPAQRSRAMEELRASANRGVFAADWSAPEIEDLRDLIGNGLSERR